MKLEWMKEVDWKKGLTEDLRMVDAVCGEDTVLTLLECLAGQRIHVSTTPIRQAQRAYILKYARQKSPVALATETGASVGFVRKVLMSQKSK